MKKGLSTIVSVILVLLIAVATTVLVIMWLPKLTFKIFNLESSFNQSYVRSRACLSLENVDTIGKTLTIKNCGKITLGDFNFYIDENKLSLYLEKLDPQESVKLNYIEYLKKGYHNSYVSSNYAETPVVTFYKIYSCDVYIYQSMIPYMIDQSNRYYCLAENVHIDNQNAINFSSGVQNTTLECQGYNLDGNSAPNTNGVYLTGASTKNNIIENCNITDFYTGIYLQNGPSNNILNNTVSSNSYSIWIASSSNNTLTNNTLTNFYDAGILISNSNDNTITGGSINSNCYDYYLINAGMTNNFINTNFTQRNIYFDDSTSWFNYNNDTTGNIWLKTSVSAQAAINPYRKLINWNQTLIKWNDTSTTAITATYNITGLLTNTNYNVYNNSVTPTYTINSGSIGQINFTINLPANLEHEIRVEKLVFDGVLWFKFNEGSGTKTYDSSTYHNDGTFYGETFNDGISYSESTPTDLHTSSDKYGKALQFDGVNDFVNSTGYISGASILSNGITFAAWIKTSTSTIGAVVGQDTQTGCNYYCLGGLYVNYVSGKASMTVYNDTAYIDASSSKIVNDNQWHFIVGTYNISNYIEIYVDGVKEKSSFSGGIYGASPKSFIIGRQDILRTDFFNGIIDEVRIWNRTLNQAEIQAEMNSSMPISRPVASYSFEEPSAATYVNDTHIWVNGTYGSALSFDGANNYIDLGNKQVFNVQAITVTAWVKTSKNDWNTILVKDNYCYNGYWFGLDSTASPYLYTWTGGDAGCNNGLRSQHPYSPISDGLWHFVAVTYDGYKVNYYLGNSNIYTYDYGSYLPIGASTSNLIIGDSFNGIVDEVRVWSRALNSTEINAEMSNG
jgi:parallel beta-helix repeat protein